MINNWSYQHACGCITQYSWGTASESVDSSPCQEHAKEFDSFRASLEREAIGVLTIGISPDALPLPLRGNSGVVYNVGRQDRADAGNARFSGAEYFVLDLTNDPHAVHALSAYALSLQRQNGILARELRRAVATCAGIMNAVNSDGVASEIAIGQVIAEAEETLRAPPRFERHETRFTAEPAEQIREIQPAARHAERTAPPPRQAETLRVEPIQDGAPSLQCTTARTLDVARNCAAFEAMRKMNRARSIVQVEKQCGLYLPGDYCFAIRDQDGTYILEAPLDTEGLEHQMMNRGSKITTAVAAAISGVPVDYFKFIENSTAEA
jgi:hypothetical protein